MTQMPQNPAIIILNHFSRISCVCNLMTISIDLKQDFRNNFYELNGCHTKCFTPPHPTPPPLILVTPLHSHLTSIAVSYKS